MNKIQSIVGYGKDASDGAKGPVEAPDSLQSQAFARVLDLVCEGPIKGLVNGYQSIYLNDTPLKNVADEFNFTGVGVDYRLGTQAQNYIPGFADTESEVGVGVPILAGVPVVRSISASSPVSAMRVRISVPTLSLQDTKTGDLNGSSVGIAIDLDSGGGFVPKITDTITGKTTSKYERAYTIELTGAGPWTVRVRRTTPDSDSVTLQNLTNWETYTLIEDGKLRYPNSALMAVMVDASQFSSIPTRSYDLYLREIQVPINYNPDLRTYDGVWDGTFKVAWTDNPAWALYDMLTEKRFGLGKYLGPDIVDKWGLYQIAKYCDELVPDGRGGMEPRFTCNLYLQTREEAFKVLSNMASIFRGIMYWGSSLLTPVQDAPSDPVALYTPANVLGGQFTYSGSDLLTRFTVAVVQWNDPEDGYKQKYEYVEDSAGIQRYGIIQTETVAIGCTSQGQANRCGRWLLYTVANETDLVAFGLGLDGAIARPGQIVQVADPLRAAIRLGGRIRSATASTVVLDDTVVIEPGKGYTLSCMLPTAPVAGAEEPDGAGMGKIESRVVINAPGNFTEIVLETPFSEAPQQYAVWILSVNDLQPQMFRVISVTEEGKLEYSITALTHNPSKFDHVDLGSALQTVPIRKTQDAVPAPTGVVISQHEYTDSLGVKLILSVGWIAPGPALTYKVEWKRDENNWVELPPTGATTIDLPGSSTPGTYTARVTAINAVGKSSKPSQSLSYTLVGKTDIPPGITGLRADSDIWQINLSWDFAPNQPDLLSTEVYACATNDRSQAVLLSPVSYPTTTTAEKGLGNGVTHYYWARTQNTSLVYSPWFPESPLAGIAGTTVNDATKILTMLSGLIAGSNAGLTIGQHLDQLDFLGVGFQQQIVEIENDTASLHTEVDTIGASLSPGGTVAQAISRLQQIAAVTVATPHQATEPADPALGQAYYDDSTGGALKYWIGDVWVLASSAINSATEPAHADGTLWKDTSTSKNYYKIWSNGAWNYATRATIYSNVPPPTGPAAVSDTWKNPDTDHFFVFDGTIWVDTQSADTAAIATSIISLQTTVDGYTTQIQQNTTSVNGVVGLYSLKIDNNGHVAGFALGSTLLPDGSGAISDFVVDANRFAVGDSTLSATYPFIITGGVAYIKSALIEDLGVTTLKIGLNAVTIPVVSFVPGEMALSGSQQEVARVTVNWPIAPMVVNVQFCATVANGGGGNGSTDTFVYRNGVQIFVNQDGIVNNLGVNRAMAIFSDTPPAGISTYTVQCQYSTGISSASMSNRNLLILGAMR